jgi:hypothetical protein
MCLDKLIIIIIFKIQYVHSYIFRAKRTNQHRRRLQQTMEQAGVQQIQELRVLLASLQGTLNASSDRRGDAGMRLGTANSSTVGSPVRGSGCAHTRRPKPTMRKKNRQPWWSKARHQISDASLVS